jgi:hypothetical protein
VKHAEETKQIALSVSCAVRGLGLVGLRLVKPEGEGVRAVIDPGIGAGRLALEKGAVLTRLRSLGVPVSSLEVGEIHDATEGAVKMRCARAGREEDEYEDSFS